LFREPLAGLEPQLAPIESALEEISLDPLASLSVEQVERLISDARAARTRVREAAYQQLHRDPYHAEMATGILARVPAELDALTENVVTTASERLGFSVERMRGRRKFAIEFGSEALIDSLPGVAGGSSFVGSFDREEAVEDETIDFFASGHVLVEGLLGHVEDSADGRVAFLEVRIGQERGEGTVVFYKDGSGVDVVALDAEGRPRPEWAAAFKRRPLLARRMPDDLFERIDWAGIGRRAGDRLDPARRPHAVAAIVIRNRV
jgi:ATP-dependent helicase HepA